VAFLWEMRDRRAAFCDHGAREVSVLLAQQRYSQMQSEEFLFENRTQPCCFDDSCGDVESETNRDGFSV
jgi:hypothetical protein